MKESDKLHIVYTPKIWVDRCHEYMEEIFTDDWRNQCVWDLSCGDRAMTRDYQFMNLHSSDIRLETKPDFVYDATVLDESSLPEPIVVALAKREPLVIFTNIPFGVVGDRIRDMVVDMKLKYDARIIFACITNVFMSGVSKRKERWCDNFWYLNGFIFPSTEFPGIKQKWPVAFSIWVSRNCH